MGGENLIFILIDLIFFEFQKVVVILFVILL